MNTHLEERAQDIMPEDPDPLISAIQALQAQELVGILSDETLPTVVVGDFNSDPRDPVISDPGLPFDIVPPYKQMLFNGYSDAWRLNLLKFLNPDGFTCCQDERLNNSISALDDRIDFIFVRNRTEGGSLSSVGPVFAVVVADEPRDRTESGLWPSDHAGVVARIFIPALERTNWRPSSKGRPGRGFRRVKGDDN